MKKKLVLGMVCLASATFAGKAQGCNGYAAMKTGTKFVLTSYSKGDMNKVASTSVYEVKSSSTNSATLHLVTTESGGKETVNASYEINCTGNGILIDQKALLSHELEKSSSGTDVKTEVSGTNLEIPSDLNVGQNLPDSRIEAILHAGNIKMDVKVDVHNRKVAGKETITVPAGTFDCYIITDESFTKTLVSKTTTHKIWVAKGIGTVKQETYDKKGKLEKLQLLTSLDK